MEGKNKRVVFVLFPIIIIIGAVALYFYRGYKATHSLGIGMSVAPTIFVER